MAPNDRNPDRRSAWDFPTKASPLPQRWLDCWPQQSPLLWQYIHLKSALAEAADDEPEIFNIRLQSKLGIFDGVGQRLRDLTFRAAHLDRLALVVLALTLDLVKRPT